MFKLKSTKKSSINVNSINIQSVSQKKLQLNQNNDLINIPKTTTQHTIRQNQQQQLINPPNLLRNTSLRPRSGINKNNQKGSKLKHQKSDQQMIQQRIKQKLMAATTLQRPSTSGMNENSGIRYGKTQKLLNRRGTINMVSSSNNPPKTKNLGSNAQLENNYDEIEQRQQDTNYISNDQALNMIQQILDRQPEYLRLKATNPGQFQRMKQKLISNASIIVLKWYKLLQDQLYNEVKSLGTKKQQSQNTQSSVPKSIQQLISKQIRKHFLKQNGLFTVQQRCSNQQSKLQRLIDTRLQKLQSLLIGSNGSK